MSDPIDALREGAMTVEEVESVRASVAGAEAFQLRSMANGLLDRLAQQARALPALAQMRRDLDEARAAQNARIRAFDAQHELLREVSEAHRVALAQVEQLQGERRRVEAAIGQDVIGDLAASVRAKVGELERELDKNATWAAGRFALQEAAEARAAALEEEISALMALYDAVEKDECTATYCAQQRGGMVRQAWLKVHVAAERGLSPSREGRTDA